MRNLLVFLFLCLLLTGCSNKTTFVLLPDPDGKVGQIDVSNDYGVQSLDQPRQTVVVDSSSESPGAVGVMSEKKITSLFGRALDAQPEVPHTILFYFNSDSVELKGDSRQRLAEVVQVITERKSRYLAINGHADRVGNPDYNYKLSLRRAQQVAALLEELGVDPDIMFIVSHGEGNPLVPTGKGVSEPRNRRVEVIVR